MDNRKKSDYYLYFVHFIDKFLIDNRIFSDYLSFFVHLAMTWQSIRKAISQQDGHPLSHSIVLSFLRGYKRPNDKIHELVKENVLLPLKKGFYVAGPSLEASKPEPYPVANVLYGPSYISLQTALSYHGMIPESVYEIASMTTKASRSFSTPIGVFSYTKLPLPYYAYGIEQLQLTSKQRALMASPEKALCDTIVATSGIVFRSRVQARDYVLENLRIDETRLRSLNATMMESWLKKAPKRSSLEMLLNIIATV